MSFVTKIDLSSNRQAIQNTLKITEYSGTSIMGTRFADLPSGPDLSNTGITSSLSGVDSTFTATTTGSPVMNVTYGNPYMGALNSELTVITSGNSGTTQFVGPAFTATSSTTINENNVDLEFSGISYSFLVYNTEVVGTNIIGSATSEVVLYSAGTLDYTGSTAWIQSKGDLNVEQRLTTDRLTVSGDAAIGSVLVCINANGDLQYQPYSGGGGSSLWSASTGTNSFVPKNQAGNIASGDSSFAFGSNSIAGGNYSFVAGSDNGIHGGVNHNNSALFGYQNNVVGVQGAYSFAAGLSNILSADVTTAFGTANEVGGPSSFAVGQYNIANGFQSFATGVSTRSLGNQSHTEGDSTTASGNQAHAEGSGTIASASQTHAEGHQTVASGNQSHAEGNASTSNGTTAHAEGNSTIASGTSSHSEGQSTIAGGFASHAEGSSSSALGANSHAEGTSNVTYAANSHVEGAGNIISPSASNSHVEGASNTASGPNVHVGGASNNGIGVNSYVGGSFSTASGSTTFVHGVLNNAGGDYSAIIGGSGNTLTSSAIGSVILGCSGITATSANTVYTCNVDSGNYYSGGTNLLDIFTNVGASTNKFVTTTGFTGATPLVITHDLNTSSPIVQVVDSSGVLVIPDSVSAYTLNTVTITLSPTDTYTVIVDGGGSSSGNLQSPYESYRLTGTTAYTLSDSVNTVVVNNSLTTTVTLPASPIKDRFYIVKSRHDASLYPITIDGNGNNIDGNATILINTNNNASYLFLYDGTEFIII